MSVFDKIPQAVESIKNFDEEKPTMSVESNNHIVIENYRTIRLFTDTEIGIDFDEFVMTITGTDLVINKFTPSMIKISGRISAINYIERR